MKKLFNIPRYVGLAVVFILLVLLGLITIPIANLLLRTMQWLHLANETTEDKHRTLE